MANEGYTAEARCCIVVGCTVEVSAAMRGLRDRSLEERIRPKAETPRTIHTQAIKDKGALSIARRMREMMTPAVLPCDIATSDYGQQMGATVSLVKTQNAIMPTTRQVSSPSQLLW